MKILVIVIVLCFASRAFAQTVVQSGTCTGASTAGVFTTATCPITGVTAGDTIVAEVTGNSSTLGNAVVSETAVPLGTCGSSGGCHSRISQLGIGQQPPIAMQVVDIVNASASNYTLSSKLGTGVTKQTWIWMEISGVTTTPFDQSGAIVNNGSVSTTLFGATTSGTLANVSEIAVEFGGTNNNESSFGSPTISGWSVPTNGTQVTAPSGVAATFDTASTAAVVGTNFSPLHISTYSIALIVTYIASTQATPTATATATATFGTPTPTATATATASPTCTATPSTPTPTATPTAAACVVPAVLAYQTPVPFATPTMSQTFTYGNTITLGDSLMMNAALLAPAATIATVSDNVNGNWHPDVTGCGNLNNDIEDEIWRFPTSAAASASSLTVTITFAAPTAGNITFADAQGLTSTDAVGLCNTGSDTTLSTGLLVPNNVGGFIWGGIAQVGSNAFISIVPSNPTFTTAVGGNSPLNVPLWVPQNQFIIAQASILVMGTPMDYAGALVAYNVCAGSGGNGNVYSPPAY
jgi:hypothetical protein